MKAHMEEKAPDQPDANLGVGGKHLAPKTLIDYIRSFLILTAISGLLAFGGLMGLRIADFAVIMPELSFVPQTQVSVVDGTNTGIAQQVSEELTEAGWNIVSSFSLDQIDPSSPVAVNTLIFVTEEGFRDEARALVARFPEAIITVSDQFPDPITLVIGLEYLD